MASTLPPTDVSSSTTTSSPDTPTSSSQASQLPETLHMPDPEVYDLITLGFGPSGLSLAISHADMYPNSSHKLLFIEQSPSFAWHPGLLVPGAKMQISFLKDLATMRDPRSRFTFVNYLHEQGRLARFMNVGAWTPSRREFSGYLAWCAEQVHRWVRYGERGVQVLKADDGLFEVVSINVTSGEEKRQKTKNVVIATGGKAYFPSMFLQGARVVHASTYMFCTQLADVRRTVVIGGGQSAAEVVEDLAAKYPTMQIDMLLRGRSLKPSDDSPFVNEIFDADQIDGFYDADEHTRIDILQEYRSTNYGVVRGDLLERLYERSYAQRVEFGNDELRWQLRILSKAEVQQVTATETQTTLKIKWETESLEKREEERPYDLVVLATGYEHGKWKEMLEGMGDPKTWTVERDYRLNVQNNTNSKGNIWLQGVNEKTHGVSQLDRTGIGLISIDI
jgi:L-ornithine N5-oxygenase